MEGSHEKIHGRILANSLRITRVVNFLNVQRHLSTQFLNDRTYLTNQRTVILSPAWKRLAVKFLAGNQLYVTGVGDEDGVKKNIDIFTYKQWLLSIACKQKLFSMSRVSE